MELTGQIFHKRVDILTNWEIWEARWIRKHRVLMAHKSVMIEAVRSNH